MKSNFYSFTTKGKIPKILLETNNEQKKIIQPSISVEEPVIKPIEKLSLQTITLKPKINHKNNIHFVI